MLARPLQEPLLLSNDDGCCRICRLRKLACFCDSWPNLNSNLVLNIVEHGEELKKDSNTALLLWKALPDSLMQIWQRKEAIFDDDVCSERDSESLPVLLMPARMANAYRGEEGRSHPMLHESELLGRAFVLLDGSWQQARKMYRQSLELQCLPCYELTPDEKFPLKDFKLRRNQQTEGFCSAQAIALLLWRMGDETGARALLAAYEQFSQHVMASRSNHAP